MLHRPGNKKKERKVFRGYTKIYTINAQINGSTLRFAGEICTSGRGEIKLREWPQNDSMVLFNDSYQHYSVIPETHFREADFSHCPAL